MDPPLAHHRIAASLAGQPLGREIEFHAAIGSTNDEARRLAEAGYPEGVVVFADSQSRGRGRRGTEWFSAPRRNLLFSVLLRPSLPPGDWPRLAHMAGLAVCDGIAASVRLEAQIKWPNDVYLDGKKVSGLLLESCFPAGRSPFAVLGIGLNVNLLERDLPLDLRRVTTSLRLARGGDFVEREPVAIAVLRALNRCYVEAQTDFATMLAHLRRRSCLLGRLVRAEAAGTEITGRAVDFGPQGELIIESGPGQRHTLAAADLVRPLDQ